MFVINAGKYYICNNNSHLKIIFRHSCIFFKKLAGRTLNCRTWKKYICSHFHLFVICYISKIKSHLNIIFYHSIIFFKRLTGRTLHLKSSYFHLFYLHCEEEDPQQNLCKILYSWSAPHLLLGGRLISHPVELVGDVIEQHKEITGNRNSGDTFAALLRWGKLHQEHRWYYHHHQSTRKTTHNCPTTKGTFRGAAMVIQIPTIIWKFPLNLKCPRVFRGGLSTLKW